MSSQEHEIGVREVWDWALLGVAAFSLALETVLLLIVWRTPSWSGGLYAVHAFLSLVLGAWAYRAWAAGRDSRNAWLLALFTLFTGPVGTGGVLLTMVLGWAYSRQASSFELWYASLFPEQDTRMPAMLAEAIARKGAAGVQPEVTPFSEVFAFGTKEEKLEALLRMTRKFNSGFAPLLKLALNDPVNTVRVQAAAAITKLESDFLSACGRLSEEHARRPQDLDLLREMARHYDDYAFTGLLDSLREQDNRARALQLYREYLRLRPGEEQVRLAIGRILMRQGDYRQAAGWFEECLASGCDNSQVVLWHMEALARLGRYAEVRKLARARRRELEDETEFPAEIVGAVRLWSGDEFSAAGVPVA